MIGRPACFAIGTASLHLFVIVLGMKLAGFLGMVNCLGGVARGDMCMMASSLGIFVAVMLGRLAVVASGLFVVFGCVLVMLARIVLR